jgi:hypothetical protein
MISAERFAARPACSLRGIRVWAGGDNAWEQEKLEARKMLENAARAKRSPTRQVQSAGDLPVRCVSWISRIEQNIAL